MFQDAELSPDGKKIAFFMDIKGQGVIATINAPPAADAQLTMYPLGVTERPWNIDWANDDVLLFSTGKATSRGFNLRPGEDPYLINETSLFSTDPGLQSIVELNKEPKEAGKGNHPKPLSFSSITSTLPKEPEAIMQSLSWREWGVSDLYRTNVRTGELTLVEKGVLGTTGFLVDRDGEPRVRYGLTFTSEKQSMFVRAPGGGWRDVSDLVRGEKGFIPLGFGSDAGLLYVASNHDADTLGLWTFDLAALAFKELIFRHPRVDIDGLVRDAGSDDIIGVAYTLDEPEIHYFDEAVDAQAHALRAAFSGAQVNTSSYARSAGRSLMSVSSASKPTELYIIDTETGARTAVGPVYPKLRSTTFGSMVAANYSARDGLEIPAYITLPPSVGSLAEAHNLPFVVLPHGGPTSRDYLNFDWFAQFFATRGYGVLQMNFRGSAGYGDAFERAGRGEWGGKMQDDVEDGARWLVSQGYADPSRMALVGWSYGGYAALMGSIKSPDLFQCAISINGVSDLVAFREKLLRYWGGRRAFKESFDGVDLRAMSPALNAEKVAMPVYLAQGGVDTVVLPEHGLTMQAALEKAGKEHEWLPIPLGDHSLQRQPDRTAMLEGAEAFLLKHIGPGHGYGG